jgi:hypothetical protein
MLQILNRTRLQTALTLAFDQQGAERIIVVARGTFTVPRPGGDPHLHDEQLPAQHADVFRGEPGASSLVHPADLVLGKPATDVFLVGSARSPGSRPVRRLEVGLRVGSMSRRAVISGDRRWGKGVLGVGIGASEPAPFVEMPLVYERAFGGADPLGPKGTAPAWDSRNPVGCGYRVHKDSVDGAALPNIEYPGRLMTSWDDKPPIAGFGPIAASWDPRPSYAGTYDGAWQESRSPLLPDDFDLRYFNAAPDGLVATGYLRGGEPVELVNLAETQRIAFVLPTIDVRFALRVRDTVFQDKADLWTVSLEPTLGRFSMTWGASFGAGKQPSHAYHVEVEAGGPLAGELNIGTSS